MNDKIIITIGRQFGSGGREIGEALAKQLNIPFYDKELIQMAAKESGIREDLFADADEQPTNSLLYSMVMGAVTFGNRMSITADMPLKDQLYIIQADVIRDLAQKQSCVIVGRCADYILKENPHCINVFVHADKQYRRDKAVNVYHVDANKAEDIIQKTDKKRANHYTYYTGKKWGDIDNYHLAIDSSVIGTDNAVQLIRSYIQMKEDFLNK